MRISFTFTVNLVAYFRCNFARAFLKTERKICIACEIIQWYEVSNLNWARVGTVSQVL